MGQQSSCTAKQENTTDLEKPTFSQINPTKIHPLYYIKPVSHIFEDPETTYDFESTSKTSFEEKQNINIEVKVNQTTIMDFHLEDQQIIYKKVEVKWNTFIKMKRKNFLNDYKIISEIGKGGFGCVYKVVMRNGSILRAAKKINKNTLKKEEHQNLLAEMAIMMDLDHPNITKLYQVYDQHNHYVMIMELCEGGELFQRIVKRAISQNDAKSIIAQVLSALHYMHSRNIVHRDIKPENMLFERKTKLIKIIDFGISTKIQKNETLSYRVGTPYYIAPEVLKKSYDFKCDIWSLGIVMYMIIYNTPPYKGDTALRVMQSIIRDQVHYKNPNQYNFSINALDFLRYLLTKDPNKRPNAEQALNHNWLENQGLLNSKKLSLQEKEKILQRITKFHFNNKLQAVVYTYIVSQLLSSEERMELLEIFRELDTNKNGIIEIEELKQALSTKALLTQEKVKIIMDYLDTNCSGFVDYTEFLVGALDFKTKIQQKHLEQAFAYFDIDGSGQITFQEVTQFLQDQITTRAEVIKLFKQVDKNGDGVISKSQFIQLLARQKMSSN